MKNPIQSLENTVITTKISEFFAWARKNSLWPYPFGTACCGIEYMAVVGPKYDISRFGAEVVRFSPRQCDLMIVASSFLSSSPQETATAVKAVKANTLSTDFLNLKTRIPFLLN